MNFFALSQYLHTASGQRKSILHLKSLKPDSHHLFALLLQTVRLNSFRADRKTNLGLYDGRLVFLSDFSPLGVSLYAVGVKKSLSASKLSQACTKLPACLGAPNDKAWQLLHRPQIYYLFVDCRLICYVFFCPLAVSSYGFGANKIHSASKISQAWQPPPFCLGAPNSKA